MVVVLLLQLTPFLADSTDSHVVVGLVVGLNPSTQAQAHVTHSRVQGVAQSTIKETVQRRDRNVTNSRILHVVVKQRLSQVEADSQPQAQGAYFVDSVGGGSENPWRVTLGLCGWNVSFKIDTGADVNVVSKRTYNSFSHITF